VVGLLQEALPGSALVVAVDPGKFARRGPRHAVAATRDQPSSRRLGRGDLKTHQQRLIALDAASVAVLREHIERCQTRAVALGFTVPLDAFLFSARRRLHLPDSRSAAVQPAPIAQLWSAALADDRERAVADAVPERAMGEHC
jgi:hypothetical protein